MIQITHQIILGILLNLKCSNNKKNTAMSRIRYKRTQTAQNNER